MWIYDFPFCCEFGKMLQIHVFRGVLPDYYVITKEGLSKFITILHGGGSSRFITILHRGGLESLLQYYSFEWKMEGYIPFELSKKSPFHTC